MRSDGAQLLLRSAPRRPKPLTGRGGVGVRRETRKRPMGGARKRPVGGARRAAGPPPPTEVSG